MSCEFATANAVRIRSKVVCHKEDGKVAMKIDKCIDAIACETYLEVVIQVLISSFAFMVARSLGFDSP